MAHKSIFSNFRFCCQVYSHGINLNDFHPDIQFIVMEDYCAIARQSRGWEGASRSTGSVLENQNCKILHKGSFYLDTSFAQIYPSRAHSNAYRLFCYLGFIVLLSFPSRLSFCKGIRVVLPLCFHSTRDCLVSITNRCLRKPCPGIVPPCGPLT